MGKGRDKVNQFILYSSESNSRKTLTKITSVFMILTVTLLLTSTLTTNDAFASHLSEDIKWQMVFISSDSGCGNYDYHMLATYNDITEKYLDLYEINNSKYDPLCMYDKKYQSEYEAPQDLDLIILVYDRNLGESELHDNEMGGFYTHSGIDRARNHAIIFCDCSNFYYSNPVWILTHELSHFVLYYKDFEMDVIEEVIHSNDKQYDQCLEDYDEGCSRVATKISAGRAGYDYSVMPLYDPAVKKSGTSSTTDGQVSEVVLDLSKMITKWWSSGKITDEDFANAVGYVSDSNVLSSQKDSEILLRDDPIDDKKTWDELLEETTPEYWDRPVKTEENPNDIFSRIPKTMIVQDDEVFSKEIVGGLPSWFKQTALWWAQDKIPDKEFQKNVEFLLKSGIIESHTSDVLQEIISEKSNVSQEIISEKSNDHMLVLQDIEYDVNSVVNSGDLAKGRGDLILMKIKTAKVNYEFDKIDQACNSMNQFTDQVQIFLDNSNIEETSATELISSAENFKQNFC